MRAPPWRLKGGRPTGIKTLALAGIGSAVTYLAAFTLPYGLAHGIEKPLQHFGHLSGLSLAGAAGLAGSVSLLLGLYLLALRSCRDHETSRTMLWSVYVIGAACAVVLLNMYPVFSLDVFYYMSADRIWTVFHENPFVVPPLQAAHDPFFAYTRWGHYPLPYGPIWPWISAATSHFGGGDLLATLASFKALALLSYLACLPLVTWAAAGLRPARPVTATATFALNPLVLLEIAGSAHNEAVALIPVIFAIGLWARRASAAASLSIGFSLLIKATGVIAVPAILFASAKRSATSGRILPWALAHLAPAAIVTIIAWTPFWDNAAFLSPLREAGQYYQSVSSLAASLFPPAINPLPVRLVQIVLLLTFGAAYLHQRHTLEEEGRPALTAIWGLTVFYLLAVTPFLSAWYLLWPVLYASILAEPRITRLTTLLCAGAFGSYLVQFVARPALNLGGMETSTLGLATIAAPFLAGLVWPMAARRCRALFGRQNWRLRARRGSVA